MVGRWTPKDSDDYVRNYKAVVRRLLGTVVRDIIAGIAFTTMDEQGCMDELHEVLIKTNVEKQQAADEIQRLTADSKVWLVYITHPSPSLARSAAESRPDVAASVVGKGSTVGEGHPAKSGAAASSAGDRRTGVTVEEEAEESEEEEACAYLVAGTQRKGTCLHRSRGCWRARQRRFSTWEMFQSVPQCGWDRFCQDCWPKEAPLDDDAESPCSASAGSTSSSQGSSTPPASPMTSPR